MVCVSQHAPLWSLLRGVWNACYYYYYYYYYLGQVIKLSTISYYIRGKFHFVLQWRWLTCSLVVAGSLSTVVWRSHRRLLPENCPSQQTSPELRRSSKLANLAGGGKCNLRRSDPFRSTPEHNTQLSFLNLECFHRLTISPFRRRPA